MRPDGFMSNQYYRTSSNPASREPTYRELTYHVAAVDRGYFVLGESYSSVGNDRVAVDRFIKDHPSLVGLGLDLYIEWVVLEAPTSSQWQSIYNLDDNVWRRRAERNKPTFGDALYKRIERRCKPK